MTYHIGDFEGQGTVWNLSTTGWRVSGDLPLRVDEICSLTVRLPTEAQVYVTAGIVRWVRGEEFGLETLVMDEESRMDLYAYLWNELPINSHRMARKVVPDVASMSLDSVVWTFGPLARSRWL
jgi:hypothetical protein